MLYKLENKISKGWLSVVLVAMLSGCAAQQAQNLSAVTPEQSDARTRAAIHTELGASYYGRAQYAVALEELHEAIRSDPSYAAAYSVLGLVHMELREDDVAVRNFEQSLRLSPNDSDTNNNYGWFLCQRNRIDESIKYFMLAVKNPLFATPDKSYVNAGVCLQKKNDLAGAEDMLGKALRIQPKNAQALYNMGNLSYTRGQFVEAKFYVTQLAQAAQDNAESLWLGLRVVRKLGEKNAETTYALQLKRKFPNSIQTQLLLSGRYE